MGSPGTFGFPGNVNRSGCAEQLPPPCVVLYHRGSSVAVPHIRFPSGTLAMWDGSHWIPRSGTPCGCVFVRSVLSAVPILSLRWWVGAAVPWFFLGRFPSGVWLGSPHPSAGCVHFPYGSLFWARFENPVYRVLPSGRAQWSRLSVKAVCNGFPSRRWVHIRQLRSPGSVAVAFVTATGSLGEVGCGYGSVENRALVGRSTAVRRGLRVEQSLQRGGSKP